MLSYPGVTPGMINDDAEVLYLTSTRSDSLDNCRLNASCIMSFSTTYAMSSTRFSSLKVISASEQDSHTCKSNTVKVFRGTSIFTKRIWWVGGLVGRWVGW